MSSTKPVANKGLFSTFPAINTALSLAENAVKLKAIQDKKVIQLSNAKTVTTNTASIDQKSPLTK